MSLIRRGPYGRCSRFDPFFDDGLLEPFSVARWNLSVDVYEEDENMIVKACLPEIKASDIDISFNENVLTLAGRRKEEKETTERNYHSKEIRHGSFLRSIHLPKSVDVDKARAKYKDGVLTITTPIMFEAEEKVKKIQIEE